MKARYESAELEVMKFALEDVIATSGEETTTTTSSEHYNPNCENEGPAGDAFL